MQGRRKCLVVLVNLWFCSILGTIRTKKVYLKVKKFLAYLNLLAGGLIALVGAVFVFMYFWEGIIVRTGEPDQSLIFWYLPVLFIGFTGVIGGLAMLVYGLKSLKDSH